MKRNEIKFVAVLVALLVMLLAGGVEVLGAMANGKFGFGSQRYIATENGQGSINTSFSASVDVEIIAVYLHTSVNGGSGDFVMQRDSATSTSYNYVILTQDMSSVSDIAFPTSSRRIFQDSSDSTSFTWTSPITTTTWGLEVHYERR